MMMLRSYKGFTLLEILIVLAILAILVPIIYSFAGRYTARLQLENASQVLSQRLNEIRNNSRRTSVNWVMRYTASSRKLEIKRESENNTQWKSAAGEDSRIPVGVTVAGLPTTIDFGGGAGSGTGFKYAAPYGRLDDAGIVADTEIILSNSSYPGMKSTIVVVGSLGKVNKVDRL